MASHLANECGHGRKRSLDPSKAFAPASMVRSPLTIGIFFVLAGYYLFYYAWVLWKSKHLEASDIEADSAAPAQ